MSDSYYPDLKRAVERIMKQVPYGAIIATYEIRDDLEKLGYTRHETFEQEINTACRSLIRDGKPMREEHPGGFWERR